MKQKKQLSEQRKSSAAMLVIKKLIAAIITILVLTVLIAETYTLVTQFVPYVLSVMFKTTGISIAEGLTFAEFSVGDFVVMLIFWLIPAVLMAGLLLMCQWALIKWIFRKLAKLWKNAFVKIDTSSNSDNQSQ